MAKQLSKIKTVNDLLRIDSVNTIVGTIEKDSKRINEIVLIIVDIKGGFKVIFNNSYDHCISLLSRAQHQIIHEMGNFNK